jgi:TolA-binding protein
MKLCKMKKPIGILLSAVVLFMISCQPESVKLAEKINDNEKKLVNDSTKMMNRPLAEEQLKAYNDFIDKFPDDPQSEKFLYNAARLADGLGQSPVALEMYHRFYEKYPKNPDAPVALFMQGYIYEDKLKNLEKAKELYTIFLSTYPDNELAASAKFSLDNLGKSNDELIKMFEEKNKEMNASAK